MSHPEYALVVISNINSITLIDEGAIIASSVSYLHFKINQLNYFEPIDAELYR